MLDLSYPVKGHLKIESKYKAKQFCSIKWISYLCFLLISKPPLNCFIAQVNLLAPGVVSAVGFTEARSGFKEIRNIQRLDMQLSPFLRIWYLVMARYWLKMTKVTGWKVVYMWRISKEVKQDRLNDESWMPFVNGWCLTKVE